MNNKKNFIIEIIMFFSIFIFIIGMTYIVNAIDSTLKGDANCDGNVSITDLI